MAGGDEYGQLDHALVSAALRISRRYERETALEEPPELLSVADTSAVIARFGSPPLRMSVARDLARAGFGVDELRPLLASTLPPDIIATDDVLTVRRNDLLELGSTVVDWPNFPPGSGPSAGMGSNPALRIYNVDGYVEDVDVNRQLDVDLSNVHHERDGSVTLTTDQLWMTGVGKLAGKPLTAFEGAVDPLNWDHCPNTRSFFVRMQEVPPAKPWPKIIDETVRLNPFSGNPDVTARLQFNYGVSPTLVRCEYDLHAEGQIVVDKGWVEATKITKRITDGRGTVGDAEFFRFRSLKTILFADRRRLADPILAMFWGWSAIRLVDCAAPGGLGWSGCNHGVLSDAVKQTEQMIEAWFKDVDSKQYFDAYRKIALSGTTGALRALEKQQAGQTTSSADPVDTVSFFADAWLGAVASALEGTVDISRGFLTTLTRYYASTLPSQSAREKTAASQPAPAEKTAAKKTAAKKTPGKKSAGKKSAGKKTTARQAATKKTTAKKTTSKKMTAKKTTRR